MLQSLREQRGLTQSQLCAQVGVSPAQMSSIEGGSRRPSLRVFMKIVDALRLSPPEAISLGLRLAGGPVDASAPLLGTSMFASAVPALPLTLDGQPVELIELHSEAGAWSALVRPSAVAGGAAHRVSVVGLALVPRPALRAA